MSLGIIITLVFGMAAGYFLPNGPVEALSGASTYLLYILLFSVGIDMGLNRDVFQKVKQMGGKILWIPIFTILGALLGGVVTAILLQMNIKEGLAISAGMGWYSLSGILITEAGNPIGGTISFLANVFREILTFIFVPVIAKYLNGYCAIAPAGATAMDTTLAVISRNTNGKIAVLAFLSGVMITMIVPFLVPIFL